MNEFFKLHWYCFSYSGIDLDSGKTCQASTYTGFDSKVVTVKRITENKLNAGVSDDSVLIAVSYLGYMLKSDFVGK